MFLIRYYDFTAGTPLFRVYNVHPRPTDVDYPPVRHFTAEASQDGNDISRTA